MRYNSRFLGWKQKRQQPVELQSQPGAVDIFSCVPVEVWRNQSDYSVESLVCQNWELEKMIFAEVWSPTKPGNIVKQLIYDSHVKRKIIVFYISNISEYCAEHPVESIGAYRYCAEQNAINCPA